MSDSDLTPVSVTQGDRVLTGVGADPEQLAQTMERHAPEGAAEPVETPREEPAAEPATERPTKGRQRFAQLTAEREQEKQRREAVEKERDDLKQRLEASTRPAAPPTAEPVTRETPKTPETRSKPTESQVGSVYPTYGDFVEDLADWKAEQRFATLDIDAQVSKRIEADQSKRTALDRLAQIQARGRAAYPDFDAKLQAPHVANANWPAQKLQMLFELEAPEHIQYALANDPALTERLRTEPNLIKFGMDIAKLIPASPVVSPASTVSAGTVNAPPPYQPVGSGSKTTAPPLTDLPKKGGYDFDKSGYRERRAAERGVTRRR